MSGINWQRRLSIVLSAIWIALAGAISSNERNGLFVFLMVGILPVAIFWGGIWVWSGYRGQRSITEPASADDSQGNDSVTKATLFRWLAIMLIASGIGIFYYAFSNTKVNPADKIAYMVGFYFWVPILVYLLWKGVFKKRKGVFLLLFSIAFLGIAIYQSHTMIREEVETKLLLSKAQAMMLKLMNGELVDRTELASVGRYSAMLLVAHDFLSQVFNDFKALNLRIENSGLETMLSPQTFQNVRKIDAALTTLQELEAQIDRTDKKLIARYNDFPRQIDSSDIPYSAKADFKNGAERGINRGKKVFAEFFSIQRAFIATAVELLHFMKVRQGHFKQHGDHLLFESQKDLDAYNRVTIQQKMYKRRKNDLTRFLDKKVKMAWRSAIGLILMSGSLRRLGVNF